VRSCCAKAPAIAPASSAFNDIESRYVSLQIPAAGTEAGAACSSQVAGVLRCSVSSNRLSLHLLGMHQLHDWLMINKFDVYTHLPWAVEITCV
jgi:hypothetical protein